MAKDSFKGVWRQVRQVVGSLEGSGVTDAELLRRYTLEQDEAAFGVLLRRHGQMVNGVCCRILGNAADAEDAFQATFLILAQEAAETKWFASVGPWLYEVAFNVAITQRKKAARIKALELESGPLMNKHDPIDEAVRNDIRDVIDEELHNLPDKYRECLVLCDLGGEPQNVVAREMGVHPNSLHKRLHRARHLLRKRLVARGFKTLSVATLLKVMQEEAQGWQIRVDLVVSTLDMAAGMKSGAVTAATNKIAAMAQHGYGSYFFARVKLKQLFVAAALFTGAVVCFGVAVGLQIKPDAPTRHDAAIATQILNSSSKPIDAALPAARAPVSTKSDASTARIAGRVLDETGQALANADVTALARRPFKAGEHGLRDDVVARGKTDSEGRFRLTVPSDFASWYSERCVTILAHAAGHAPLTLQVPLKPAASRLRIIDDELSPTREQEDVSPTRQQEDVSPTRGQEDVSPTRGQEDVSPTRKRGSAEPAEHEVEARLPKGESARGQLLDPEGRPATGVLLRVVRLGDAALERIQGSEQGAEPAGWPAPVTTDAEGRFELRGLAKQDDVWLQVDDERYGATGIRIVPGQTAEPVKLAEACWLDGRIVAGDSKQPLPGARLTVVSGAQLTHVMYMVTSYQKTVTRDRPANNFDARTDHEGRFRIRLVPGCKVELEVHPPEGAPYLGIRRFFAFRAATQEDEKRGERVIELPLGVRVNGQLVEGANNKPVPNGYVTWDAPVKNNPGCDWVKPDRGIRTVLFHNAGR